MRIYVGPVGHADLAQQVLTYVTDNFIEDNGLEFLKDELVKLLCRANLMRAAGVMDLSGKLKLRDYKEVSDVRENLEREFNRLELVPDWF